MDNNQIRIRGAQGAINVHQLTCYLSQTVLTLRDRDNGTQSVILCGTGSAIPTCVLIAEIVARKLPKLIQVTEFIAIEQKVNNNPNTNQNRDNQVTGIRIKLTYAPTEQDKLAPGYQANVIDEDKPNNWKNLYDFVMLYTNDLAAAKLEKAREKRTKTQNPRNHPQQYEQKQQQNKSNIRDNNIDSTRDNNRDNTRDTRDNRNNRDNNRDNRDNYRDNRDNYRGDNRVRRPKPEPTPSQIPRTNIKEDRSQKKTRGGGARFDNREQQEKFVQKPVENLDNNDREGGQLRTRGGSRKDQ